MNEVFYDNWPDDYEDDAQNDTMPIPDAVCPKCGEVLVYSFVTHREQCFGCGWMPEGWDDETV